MDSQHEKFYNSLSYYWVKNLVGSGATFSINMVLTITFGIAYSFKLLPSVYILLVLGVVTPLLFTFLVYSLMRESNGTILGQAMPKVFASRNSNWLFMVLDLGIVLLLAALIYFNILNYWLFRFLQTLFFPLMMLFFLRLLYINSEINRIGGKIEEKLKNDETEQNQ
ncbi:MAG: hypothetical protein JW783_06680 [Bacteroidales bacterium]|nr:hypothetical protein [Bacteroidales bacterium]MBN2750065.1 hypothetical protein [Bacteroidales bacterium]